MSAIVAYAKPDDLTDNGYGRIRIHDAHGEFDVVDYAADDDADRAWSNIYTALDEAGYNVVTTWADSPDDNLSPGAQVVRR